MIHNRTKSLRKRLAIERMAYTAEKQAIIAEYGEWLLREYPDIHTRRHLEAFWHNGKYVDPFEDWLIETIRAHRAAEKRRFLNIV